MYKKPYTMYKRFSKKRGKQVFYVRFLDSEGNRLPARNSECTSKSAAEFWAVEQLKNGITQIIKPKIETFEDFAQYFFIPGKCPYLKSLEDRQELKPAYIEKQRRHLIRDILPYLKNNSITDIQVSDVETWIQKLKDLRGPVVANRSRVTLKVVFNEAVRLKKRKTNPVDLVKKFRENPKEKGILTLSEARQLFCPGALDSVWNGELLHFTINLLGATCGLRMGETQGIQAKKVMSDHILINEAWGRNHGLLACKTSGSKRPVPIPGYLKGHINQLIQGQGLGPEDFVFSTIEDRTKPVDHKIILTNFYDALDRIDVNRKERNVTYHSHRHFFNTFMRQKQIDDRLVQAVTGHRSQKMTEHYSHFKLDAFEPVLQAQNSLWDSEAGV